jgi:hypothetical protein
MALNFLTLNQSKRSSAGLTFLMPGLLPEQTMGQTRIGKMKE